MYSLLKKYLIEALDGQLPASESHIKMLPQGRSLKITGHEAAFIKESSVLVLLFPYNNQLYTCLTKRPETLKHHPGQISFPGGKMEENDMSPEMTALREAFEEVGIISSEVEVLGCLSNLYVEVSKFSIHPVLAWTNQMPDFVINEDEVDEIILFPLEEFVENEQIEETQIKTLTGWIDVKYYSCENKKVWGATAMILSELIDVLKKRLITPLNHQNKS